MIKKCKLLYFNKPLNILAFEWDGKAIQITTILPSKPIAGMDLYIKYEDNRYSLTSESEYKKSTVKPKRKRGEEVEKVNENVNSDL